MWRRACSHVEEGMLTCGGEAVEDGKRSAATEATEQLPACMRCVIAAPRIHEEERPSDGLHGVKHWVRMREDGESGGDPSGGAIQSPFRRNGVLQIPDLL